MTSERPLPSLTEADTGKFWQSTQDEILRYQQCTGCEKVVWYGRMHCPDCLEGTLEWRESKGEGCIYSFSVVRQSYHPFFRNLVPYAVAYIDLDEGFRMLSNVVGVEDPVKDITVGQRVRLVWEHHEALNIPLFEVTED